MDSRQGKSAAIRRRMVISTLSNYVGKVYTLGVWFFLTPFILRQLGATDYGLYALVGSVAAYGLLLDFGIASAVTKYIAEFHARGQIEHAQSLVATALVLYSGLGLIAVALSVIVAPAFPILFNVPAEQRTTATWLVLLSGLGLGIALPCAMPQAVLRGLQRFDLVNLIGIVGMSLFTIATVAALSLGWGLLGIMAVNIPVTLIMQVPTIGLIHRVAPGLRLGWRGGSRRLVRTVTSFSSAMFVLDLSGQIQSKTDEIVVGAMLPVANVTPYSIARRLSEMPQILTDQFMKVLMPLASQLHAENDRGRLRMLYVTSTRLTLALFVPLACGLVILARPFLTAWVGAAYADYDYLVLILISASLIETSQWPAGSILQGIGRHRMLAVMALGSALGNLGLSLTLVRSLGLAGVALGTLIPTAIECLCFILPYVMRVNGISLRTVLTEVYLPALLPALPMSAVLYSFREIIRPDSLISIVVVGSVGLLVYAIGYMSFGAGQAERQLGRDTMLAAIRFTRAHLGRARSDP